MCRLFSRSALLPVLVAAASADVVVAAGAAFDVDVKDDGSFVISMGGETWFSGSDVFVRSRNTTYANDPSDGAATLTKGATTRTNGTDAYGAYAATSIAWTAGSAAFETSVRAYASTVIFEQRFPDGLNGTRVPGSRNDAMAATVSGWPSLRPAKGKGFVAWAGQMSGSGAFAGTTGTDDLTSGIQDTGPVAFFDDSDAVVVSVASSFMSASHVSTAGDLTYGLMGTVTSVPAGHSLEIIVDFSPGAGVNEAMDAWGAKLMARYGKDRSRAASDVTTTHLGYSTDNGAYYYYCTEPDKNYEETMLDVYDYAQSAGIPYRHVLLDSWWYYQANDTLAVTNWTARPDVFPNGMRTIKEKTGWQIVAHNRYWSGETVYAKQNGGDFEFVIEDAQEGWDDDGSGDQGSWAFPVDPEFWDYLIGSAQEDWGLGVYEQDWLHNEFERLDAPLESATAARAWLLEMGAAAGRRDVYVQYCMSWCRHIMQSVEIPAVTQARASDDYHPGADQWDTGFSSIFLHALGVIPTKDNFWSKPETRGAARYPDAFEPYNRLQAAASTLSAGPVAPSDPVGASDVELILKSCAADGKLLRPDRPATYPDAAIRAQASGEATGVVLATSSVISGLHYRYLFAATNAKAFTADAAYLYDGAPAPAPAKAVYFEANTTASPKVFDSIDVPATDKSTFVLYTVAPVLSNGWTLLGETSKWVSASNDRLAEISADADGVSATVRGAPDEAVTLAFLAPGDATIWSVECVVPDAGTVTFRMPSETCA